MFNEELYHHGIEGQKWGKQNGPPYPLSRAEHRRVIRSAKAAKKRNLSYDKAKRNARKLTDDDLDLALERLRREKEYAQLVAKPGTEPWKKEQNAVSKVNADNGKKAKIASIAGGLTTEILKKLAFSAIDAYGNDRKRRLDDIRKAELKEAEKKEKKAKDWQKTIKGVTYKEFVPSGKGKGKDVDYSKLIKDYENKGTKDWSTNYGKLSQMLNKAKNEGKDTSGLEKRMNQMKLEKNDWVQPLLNMDLSSAKEEFINIDPRRKSNSGTFDLSKFNLTGHY